MSHLPQIIIWGSAVIGLWAFDTPHPHLRGFACHTLHTGCKKLKTRAPAPTVEQKDKSNDQPPTN